MTSAEELGLLSFLSPHVQPRHLSVVCGLNESWADTLERAGLTAERRALDELRGSSLFKMWRQWIVANNVSLSVYGDDQYPIAWRDMRFAPPVITFIGRPCWVDQPLLAVVGSRNPMQESLRWMDWHLNRFLAESKAALVSGGARGVDFRAHALAVQNQLPTVAAMPVGLMQRYPETFRQLESEILRFGGAVFSPFAPDWPLRKVNFLKRNMLIAAMAKLVVIVEARRRSGTLLTAKAALDLDRPVAAVPSSPLRMSGQGSLDLLADGRALLLRDELDLSAAWSLGRVKIASQLELT